MASDYRAMISEQNNKQSLLKLKHQPTTPHFSMQTKQVSCAVLDKQERQTLDRKNITNGMILESGNLLNETYDLPKPQILDIEYEPEQQIIQDPYENTVMIGELFDTYIVLQNEDQMILIDKHAAHERLLFNKLVGEGISEEKQILLTPVTVKLTPEELAVILENRDLLSDSGLTVDNFGDGFIIVREVAPILENANLEQIVTELAQKLLNYNHNLMPKQLEDLYHIIACRAAIKAHDKTPLISLKQLIALLKEDKNAAHCPHGRPVAIRMSRHEIEKKFGRLG